MPEDVDSTNAGPIDIARLVSDHHQVLYRYAFRLTGSTPDAEDLTQQVFLVAQQKLDQIRDALRARSWLLAVMRNCYLKNRRRRVPIPAGNVDFDVNTIPDKEPENKGIDGERLQIAIDALPDEFKVPVVMFYFEQYSYKEIAEQLDLPLGTVMSRLSRAKRQMRSRLFCREHEQSPSADARAEGG